MDVTKDHLKIKPKIAKIPQNITILSRNVWSLTFCIEMFFKVLRNVSKYDMTYIKEDLRRKDFRFNAKKDTWNDLALVLLNLWQSYKS